MASVGSAARDRAAVPLPDGFAHLGADLVTPALERHGMRDWAGFAASWDRLEPDRFMADGGRYRRRRHAVYQLGHGPAGAQIERRPDRPHFQQSAHNRLNGGVDRRFAPVEKAIGAHPALEAVLRFALESFDGVPPLGRDLGPPWAVELHQFRIEATALEAGEPTPEGAHRDGVDFVLVTMIGRTNVGAGETSIQAPDGRPLGSFTLVEPRETVLVDDHRCLHGVTAVRPLDPTRPAYRDVLVVTLARDGRERDHGSPPAR